MELRAIDLKEANLYIAKFHRHHKPVAGYKFAISCYIKNKLVGVAVVSRPVSRHYNYKEILEVTRLVTDGSKNVCSFLYSASARASKNLGYKKIQTYILETESGTSLKASGWICESERTRSGQWVHSDGKKRRDDQPTMFKKRYAKYL